MHRFRFVPVKSFVKDYSGFFGLKESPEWFKSNDSNFKKINDQIFKNIFVKIII